MRGEQDDGQRGVACVHFVKQRQAILAGQAYVAQHQLRPCNVELGQGRLGRAHSHHFVPRRLQAQREQAQHVGIVIHHQNAVLGRA